MKQKTCYAVKDSTASFKNYNYREFMEHENALEYVKKLNKLQPDRFYVEEVYLSTNGIIAVYENTKDRNN